MPHDMLTAALYYRNHFGFSVIPVHEDGSKSPYIKWERYQTEKASPETIKMWWTTWPQAAIGIVTGKISNLSVVDFDFYKMTENEIADCKSKFEHILTPSATSPHHGIHLYFLYCPDLPGKANIYKHVDGRNDGNYIIAPPSQSPDGSYSWLEGKKITDIPLNLLEKHITSFFYIYIASNNLQGASHNQSHLVTYSHKRIEQGTRDESLFHLANILAKGKATREEIEYYLWLTGTYCCDPPYPENEILTKIESALKRVNAKERNIAEEVREWALVTSGQFLVTDCHNQSHLVTKEDKHAANVELARLCDAGLLERVGEKRGSYRRVEAVTFEDFQNVDFSTFEIKLPFGFEKYVDIFPGDLITFAGVRNTGKTALALEIARLNMRHHPVYYFSKEMTRQSLSVRLSKCDDLQVKDWTFKFASDVPNFIDVLQPGAINIIDYLEVDDGEYFKMADLLKKIHTKINKGNKAIAIVMLQKHSQKATADGGEKTEQKPVLCFNIDKNIENGHMNGEILKATKVKNIKDGEEDTNGWIKKFKILKGINLMGTSHWGPEMEDRYAQFAKGKRQ